MKTARLCTRMPQLQLEQIAEIAAMCNLPKGTVTEILVRQGIASLRLLSQRVDDRILELHDYVTQQDPALITQDSARSVVDNLIIRDLL